MYVLVRPSSSIKKIAKAAGKKRKKGAKRSTKNRHHGARGKQDGRSKQIAQATSCLGGVRVSAIELTNLTPCKPGNSHAFSERRGGGPCAQALPAHL